MLIELIGTVGETYIDICECDGDEHELLITEIDLLCQDCGGHQSFYHDEIAVM